MRTGFFALLTVFTLAFTSLSFAGNPGGKNGPLTGPGPGEEMFSRELAKLNLNEEQKKRVDEIRESGKREIHSLRSGLKILLWDLQDEIKMDKPDVKKIDSITDRICETEKKLMRQRTADMLKLKSILTQEQFGTLMDNMEKKKDRAKKNMLQRITGN